MDLASENTTLQAQLAAERQAREKAEAALRNIAGDNLCWITDPEQAKALPEAEFLESCRRYRQQIADERGEFTGGRTIAQLEEALANVICYRAPDGSRVWPEPDRGAEHDERVRREALESFVRRRESCHVTFNGGHHEQPEREAFHHGMDTVFNVLQGELDGQPRQDGYAVLRDRAEKVTG